MDESRERDRFASFASKENIDEESTQGSVESSPYLSTSSQSSSDLETSASSVNSLYPPASWPSDGDLAKDSDLYPQLDETTLDKEVGNVTLYPSDDDLSGKSTTGSCPCEESSRSFVVEADGYSVEIGDASTGAGEYSDLDFDFNGMNYEGTSESCQDLSKIIDITAPDNDLTHIQHFIELPIQQYILPKLCFDEQLMVSHYKLIDNPPNLRGKTDEEATESLGTMTISIQKTDTNIVIYSTSEFSLNGTKVNSSILSMVDKCFELVEEKKTEILDGFEGHKEKSLHVIREGYDYMILRSKTQNGIIKEYKDTVNMSVEGSVILDGASFLLMRYLIKTNYTGIFETWTTHISGEICRSVYISGKRKLLKIRNCKFDTIRIVRIILRKSLAPSVSKTYFLPSGHMVRHQWNNCDYIVHMNQFTCKLPPCAYFESIQNNWHEDITLQSKYLDFKDEKKSEVRSYLKDNRTITNLFSDYLLVLLEQKPVNVLDFTVDYFLNMYDGMEEDDDNVDDFD